MGIQDNGSSYMNIEEYLYDMCRFNSASITYHKEKPIVANGFEYDMHEQFDNEMEIRFPTELNKMQDFLKDLEKNFGNDKGCDWIEHSSDELMKEYDMILVWW